MGSFLTRFLRRRITLRVVVVTNLQNYFLLTLKFQTSEEVIVVSKYRLDETGFKVGRTLRR
jgi:hypothetical protein